MKEAEFGRAAHMALLLSLYRGIRDAGMVFLHPYKLPYALRQKEGEGDDD